MIRECSTSHTGPIKPMLPNFCSTCLAQYSQACPTSVCDQLKLFASLICSIILLLVGLTSCTYFVVLCGGEWMIIAGPIGPPGAAPAGSGLRLHHPDNARGRKGGEGVGGRGGPLGHPTSEPGPQQDTRTYDFHTQSCACARVLFCLLTWGKLWG